MFWLLISESFPLAVRARGMSAATIANWLANLVVALTSLRLVDLLGRPAVFLLYAALTFGVLVFAYVLVPETKGAELGRSSTPASGKQLNRRDDLRRRGGLALHVR